LFLALEGLDGSGKTTVGGRIAALFRTRGREVVETREPGGTAIGESIRDVLLGFSADAMLPQTEALLFAASRAQHVGELILPALQRGAVVISDRFTDSSLAYQWGGRGLPLRQVRGIQDMATGGLEPDVTLLFELPAELAMARRRESADESNRLDREQLEFYRRVAAAYRELVAENPARWRVVDASRPPDEVWRAVVRALDEDGSFDQTPLNVGAIEEEPR
jgi:dTMP kinase